MNKLYKYFIVASIMLVSISGCDDEDLTDLNVNPTQANVVDWRFMLTTAQVQAAENRYSNGRVHLNLAGGLIQQMATMQIGGERGSGDKYMYHLDSFNALWDRYPTLVLKTIEEVIRQTGPEGESPNSTNLHHVAQVVKALPVHLLTDMHGNIPYTELNKGIDGIFFPKYDTQESIYKSLLAILQTAANTIGTGTDELGSADVIFNGDLQKWKKFANSLMLRLAMRISNVDPGTAQTFVQAAITGGVMESNLDMAWLQMADGPSDWFNKNGMSRALNPSDWGANNMISETLVEWLKANNDPRLEIYSARGPWDGPWDFTPANQVGMPNGLDEEMMRVWLGQTEPVDREGQFSRLNPELLNDADPFIFMTHAEVEFLLAEAVMKGWGTTGKTAEEHYNDGVRSSMKQWVIFQPSKTITDAEVDAYLAANPFDGSMEMLSTQHWAANFLQWFEAYANWRRTGFPVLTPTNYPGNYSGGQIFRRIEYSTVEIANNEDNVVSGGTSPDDVMTRIWWDVN